MASLTVSRTSALVQRSAAPKAPRRGPVAVRAGPAGNWLPGTDPSPTLATTSLPGNYGFDPLRLATNNETLNWFAAAEIQNGRWAMLGASGCLAAEIFTGRNWVEVQGDEYWIPLNAQVGIGALLFNWAELNRLQFLKANPEKASYPGGKFDPAGMSNGPDFAERQLKEIKNGRLAMLACLGYFAQYEVTGKGVLESLSFHLSDPFVNNCFSNGKSLPFPPFN